MKYLCVCACIHARMDTRSWWGGMGVGVGVGVSGGVCVYDMPIFIFLSLFLSFTTDRPIIAFKQLIVVLKGCLQTIGKTQKSVYTSI